MKVPQAAMQGFEVLKLLVYNRVQGGGFCDVGKEKRRVLLVQEDFRGGRIVAPASRV